MNVNNFENYMNFRSNCHKIPIQIFHALQLQKSLVGMVLLLIYSDKALNGNEIIFFQD